LHRRSWSIVLFILGSLLVALGVRSALQPFSQVANALRPSTTAAPVSVHVEELKSSEELFAVAGLKAVVLKYSGGDVDFWIEFESHGQKTKEGAFGLKNVEGAVTASPNQTVEGYYLLVRTPSDAPGGETWRMAYERDLVAGQPSGVQVSTPPIQMNAKEASKERQSFKVSSVKPFQLWENANTEKAESTVNAFQSPLRPGETVCVAEIKGSQKKEGQFAEAFKIRIMCQAISQTEGAANNQTPPK
jgi:hypothetical protein